MTRWLVLALTLLSLTLAGLAEAQTLSCQTYASGQTFCAVDGNGSSGPYGTDSHDTSGYGRYYLGAPSPPIYVPAPVYTPPPVYVPYYVPVPVPAPVISR
jgi:hypothetical protein